MRKRFGMIAGLSCLIFGMGLSSSCSDDSSVSGVDTGSGSDGGADSSLDSSIEADTGTNPDSESEADAEGDTGTTYVGTSLKELFIDDYIVESAQNVTRILHQANKTAPVMEPEHPWEGVGTKYSATWFPGTVLQDGDTFKMWYMGMMYTGSGVANYTCYATSQDGITWTKPNLGMFDFNGSTNNNIIGGGAASVVLDDEAEPERRFKEYAGYDGGYGGYESADGLDWNKLGFHIDLGDIGTMSFDSINREYLITIKGDKHDENGFNTRKQYNVTSKDLVTYSEVARMDGLADDIDAQGYVKAASYGMGVFPYEGAYIGFNWLFLITDQTVGVGEDGYIEVDLLFKRGNFLSQWQRPSRTPIIPRGADGEWDDGMITTATSPIIVGKEMWLYYSGWDGDHVADSRTAKIAIAKWRLDGFMSLDAGATQGTVVTKPLAYSGRTLLVNADASAPGGSIQVEILDETGAVISGYAKDECDAIQSDSVEHVVSWQGDDDLSDLAGQNIRLKFHMTNAELYALQFGEPK